MRGHVNTLNGNYEESANGSRICVLVCSLDRISCFLCTVAFSNVIKHVSVYKTMSLAKLFREEITELRSRHSTPTERVSPHGHHQLEASTQEVSHMPH
ncbi:hypothetical protein RJT34_14166 [Clitoria ternatea]|uniref:Uncharacterized protein n=1 Tax=Clitoria ternatea TaxID=43366 RepID=A0AAN9JTD9_CLITE